MINFDFFSNKGKNDKAFIFGSFMDGWFGGMVDTVIIGTIGIIIFWPILLLLNKLK